MEASEVHKLCCKDQARIISALNNGVKEAELLVTAIRMFEASADAGAQGLLVSAYEDWLKVRVG